MPSGSIISVDLVRFYEYRHLQCLPSRDLVCTVVFPEKKAARRHIFGGKGNEIVHTLPLGSQLVTLSKYSKIQSERKYEIILPKGSGIS